MLLNSEVLPKIEAVRLDFGAALSINLERAADRGVVGGSIPSAFKRIVDHAESHDGDDPTWGFGDAFDLHDKRETLVGIVVSCLRGNALTTIDVTSKLGELVSLLG